MTRRHLILVLASFTFSSFQSEKLRFEDLYCFGIVFGNNKVYVSRPKKFPRSDLLGLSGVNPKIEEQYLNFVKANYDYAPADHWVPSLEIVYKDGGSGTFSNLLKTYADAEKLRDEKVANIKDNKITVIDVQW